METNKNIVNNTELPDTAVEEIVQTKTVNQKRSKHTNKVKPWTNSPVITSGENFESDDEKRRFMKKVMQINMKYIFATTVKDNEDAERRITKYIEECVDQGLHPLVEGLALCLGVTTKTLWEWETGVTKHPPVERNIIKRAKAYISNYDAQLVAEGKLNPVTYIFRAKNYYGLKDQQDVVVTPGTQLGGEDVAEAERILDALPENSEETT